MRRILDALLPIIFVFLLCFFCIWIEDPELVEEWFYEINPWDYARITDVDYKAVVVDEPGNSGKILVTERLTFDVHAFSKDNLFWELWRDLCEDNVDGLKVDYKVNSVKQIMPDGSEIIYEESPKLYWDDYDYVSSNTTYGPGKWYHSPGPYNEYRRQYECVFFYVDGLYRDEVVFEIEYEMNNASLRYGDCSELYLTLFSEDSVNYLESFKAEILFPIEDMPSKGNYYYHTYGTKNLKFPVTESATKNPGYYTFSFDLDEDDLKFNPHTEYIEFDFISFGEDKHAFTDFAPRNNYYYDDGVLEELYAEHDEFIEEYEEAKKDKETTFMVCTVIALLVAFYTLGTKGRMHRKHTYYKPTTDLIYYRDIPSNLDPNFAANLVFCKNFKQAKEEDRYSSILLSLVRKKYIELEKVSSWADWEPFNTKIIIKHKPTPPQVIHSFDEVITTIHDYTNVLVADENSTNNLDDEINKLEPLTKTEEYYFNLLVRHVSFNNEILLGTFQSKISKDYVNTDAFVTNVESSVGIIGATDGYFQKFDFSQPKREIIGKAKFFTVVGLLLITLVNHISYQTTLDFAFGGFTLLGIVFLLCALYLAKTAGNYTLLTQFGEDEYQKWKGLYDFLNNDTLMSERTVVELPLWEQYLVYATAFGISDKVIAALKIRCPELPDLPENHMLNNNSYSRSHRIRHNSRSFRSSTRSASRSARCHGYGGGFGGGRGGGGGGGGH